MADRAARSAARLATAVAAPIALLAGLGAFVALNATSDEPPESAPPGRPQASSPVTVSAPPLDERAAAGCRALVSKLPAALRDRARRPVTAGAERSAAYGDPPITVACGVPAATYPPTDQLLVLDGVCWHTATTPAESVWTTVDRRLPVRVTVPAQYPGPAQWTIEFSGPVLSTLPSLADPPGGCRG
ncbi:MAG TPA: DUF3515 family protein [Pilimelia sp.]|nr:DUF3515 family protein [Pilimelia sp.]